MYTGTDGLTLPTTVTGSWPRPQWFEANLVGAPISTRLGESAYREQYLDAVKTVVSDQERAGLDIVVNGDYHLDDDLGGQSWVLYPLERISGVDTLSRAANSAWTHEPGTLLNEVMGGWRFPAVTGRVEDGVGFEFDKIWRSTQAVTDKPVKIGTISAQTLGEFVENRSDYYDDDKRQLSWDLAELVNAELRSLAAAGCKIIQIEDPLIHLVGRLEPPRDYIDFLVELLNREIEGLDSCEVWIHTCWGNPNMQRVGDETPYSPVLDDYMERVNCDVLTVEMCDRDFDEIELFERYREIDKKIAVGMISHRTLQVETTDTIAENLRKCLKYIDPEKLVLSSDCGFGRSGFNRLVAFHKAASMVRAANIVRAELGASVTRPRNSDPMTQLDIPEQPSMEPAKR